MSHGLFEKILDELSEVRPKNVIPCFSNEPFLDRRFLDRLESIRTRLPSSKITVVTNGSMLTREVCQRLLRDQSVDVLDISFQGMEKESYETSMPGMQFERNLSQIVELIQMQKALKAKKPLVQVNMVRTDLIEGSIEEAKSFWKGLGVPVKIIRLENRGGTVDTGYLASNLRTFRNCRRPFNTMVICFDGTVPLCCVDFERRVVLGDVNQRTIQEIWNGEKAMAIRRAFLDPNSSNDLPEICRNCKQA